MGIKGLKYIKGTKPNREAEQKIWNEAQVKMMVETDLHLIGWEVYKILEDMTRESWIGSKLLKTS